MNTRRRLHQVLIVLVALTLVGTVAVLAFAPQPLRYEATAGRPLLESAGKPFHDPQIGLRFMPPADWSMQARSTEAPKPRAERMLVKYKRVQPNLAAAWLRVRLKDVPADQTPAEYLKQRKPPEDDWKATGDVDDTATLAGEPAAKRSYAGTYDHDGRGAKAFVCDIVAQRRGGRFYEFAGTYLKSDDVAHEQIRAAMESVAFEP